MGMEHLTFNTGKFRREEINGRRYIVAKMRLIVPGVLNGSSGKIYYSPEENARSVDIWNGMPLVIDHPTLNGVNISARTPEVSIKSKVGRSYNTVISTNGILDTEGWFIEDDLKRISPKTHKDILDGKPVELSTGLFVDREEAPVGSVDSKGRPYDFVARNYRADHIAILPDRRGACSIADGCGVLVNQLTVNSLPLKWITLNVSRAGRTIPPKKSTSSNDDDEDFASDEQRRAFFGKLAAGKIKGTKRTRQIPKNPTRKIGKHTTADDVDSIRKGETVRDENDKEWEVVSTTKVGGKVQIHAKSGNESKVFMFGKSDDTTIDLGNLPKVKDVSIPAKDEDTIELGDASKQPKKSLLDRMKEKGRKILQPGKATPTEPTGYAGDVIGAGLEKIGGKTRDEIEAFRRGEKLRERHKVEEENAKDLPFSEWVKISRRHKEEFKKAGVEKTMGGYRLIRNDQIAGMLWNDDSSSEISSEKACKILHDGTVHGKKITDKQRRFFGARCNGKAVKNAEGAYVARKSHEPLYTNANWITLNKRTRVHCLNYSPDQPRDGSGRFAKSSSAETITRQQKGTIEKATRTDRAKQVASRAADLVRTTYGRISEVVKTVALPILSAAGKVAGAGANVLKKGLKFIKDRYGSADSIMAFGTAAAIFGVGSLIAGVASGGLAAVPAAAIGGSAGSLLGSAAAGVGLTVPQGAPLLAAGAKLAVANPLGMAAFSLAAVEAKNVISGIAAYSDSDPITRKEGLRRLTAGFTSNADYSDDDSSLCKAIKRMVTDFADATGVEAPKVSDEDVKYILTQLRGDDMVEPKWITLNSADKASTLSPETTTNLFSGSNCGIGKGGFQKGNTCAGSANPTGANPSGGGRVVSSAPGVVKEIDKFFGGWATGPLGKSNIEDAKGVAKGLFSRMTLGVGPLLAKGIAAGIRHSPKAFNLLSKGLMALMPRKQLRDKAQDLGANPSGGGTGQSANPIGANPVSGKASYHPEKTRRVSNVATPPKPDERSVARAKMYFDQLQELLENNPDEMEKLIIACKEAMKVMDHKQAQTLNWIDLTDNLWSDAARLASAAARKIGGAVVSAVKALPGKSKGAARKRMKAPLMSTPEDDDDITPEVPKKLAPRLKGMADTPAMGQARREAKGSSTYERSRKRGTLGTLR